MEDDVVLESVLFDEGLEAEAVGVALGERNSWLRGPSTI